MLLEEVRRPLLDEARLSPSLLSDLAGLEHYVAESYNARSFVELLQNADDAQATRFTVRMTNNHLLVANDGRPFNQSDFESLCRSASSTKSRGSSIGYRGIGFKSVVHFSQEIYVFSGEISAVFSRERTAQDVPNATRYPLVRIPHAVLPQDTALLQDLINEAASEGYSTVFIFSGVGHAAIEAEFDAFNASALLFLRNVRQVDIRTTAESLLTISRTSLDQRHSRVRLFSDSGPKDWLLLQERDVSLAFDFCDGRVRSLAREEAVVHAFLPTLESTGLGVKVNGDFSTDPSRTRIVLDDISRKLLQETADLYVNLIREMLTLPEPASIDQFSALIPEVDPRMAALQQQSFRTELLKAIQVRASGEFEHVRLKPSWINSKDFSAVTLAASTIGLPTAIEDIPGAASLFKFLGAKELELEDTFTSLHAVSLSNIGAAEIVATISRKHETKQIVVTPTMGELKIWLVGEKLLSLRDVELHGGILDPDFLSLLVERGAPIEGIRRLIIALSNQSTADAMLPTTSSRPTAKEAPTNLPELPSGPIDLHGVSRWRSAELQLVELLNAQGWHVADVSRRNEGYDLEGTRPNGESVCIEVKAVDSFRAPFVMTNNELLVARQLSNQYTLALVKSSQDGIEVAFLDDPGTRLDLNRQCRQWVWECEVFRADPVRYAFAD